MDIKKFHALPYLTSPNYERIKVDLVVIEPDEIGLNEAGNQEDWRWLNIYLIKHNPFIGWKRSIQSDCIEFTGHFLSDIKSNGLIHYWNPSGQLEVYGLSTLEIDSIDDAPLPSSLFNLSNSSLN